MDGSAAASPWWQRDGLAATVLRWLLRCAGLLLMLFLLWQQLLEYRAQPISTVIVRTQAPFPHLTLCPSASQRDYSLLRDMNRRLMNDSISVTDFYNLSTLYIPGRYGQMQVFGEKTEHNNIPGNGTFGIWGWRFYMSREWTGHRPIRCATLQPSDYLQQAATNQIDVWISLPVSPAFTHIFNISFFLYVHGPETPNVGDLNNRQLGVSVPRTPRLNLRPGGQVWYRVTARMRRLADVRRRPCRSEPEYSQCQCLKECLWRRLAAHIGCRLPHMVSAGVMLPEMSGPLDHLPPCRRLVQTNASRDSACCYRFQDRRTYLYRQCPFWYELTHSSSPEYEAEAKEIAFGDGGQQEEPAAQGGCPPDVGELPMPEAEQLVPQELLEDMRDCDCPPACQQVEYLLHSKRSLLPAGSPREDFICRTNVQLKLDLTTDLVEETISFTPSTLVANVGGFLGLVTGYSLFTLVELISEMVDRMSRRRSVQPTAVGHSAVTAFK